MVQLGDGLRFLVEPRRERWVLGVVGGEYLDGNIPVEIGVMTPEYRGHAASTELLNDSVAS